MVYRVYNKTFIRAQRVVLKIFSTANAKRHRHAKRNTRNARSPVCVFWMCTDPESN